MLLGLNTTISHTSPADWARRNKELGCGAVVLPVDYRAGHAKYMEYADAAKEQELVIAEVGIWKNMLAADADERREAMEYSIGQLAMAEEIGARCCVNIAGTPVPGRWDGGYTQNFTKETWDRTVEAIREIIDAVHPVHTRFTIEPMPWMVPTGPDEYLRLIDAVDRESFAVHMDAVNMINCPERYFFSDAFLRECFDKLHGRICSCHLKDIVLLAPFTFQLKEVSCGEGTLNLSLYAELATAEDEDMPLLLEHLDTEADYLKSLQYVQNRLGLSK